MMKRGEDTGARTKVKGSATGGALKKVSRQRNRCRQEDWTEEPDSLSLIRLASALSASGPGGAECEAWQLPHGEDMAEYALRNGLMAPSLFEERVAVGNKPARSGRTAGARSLRTPKKKREG
jgi:hypothetical protein